MSKTITTAIYALGTDEEKVVKDIDKALVKCIEWDIPMTSIGAARHHMTRGFVAVELYNAAVARRDGEIADLYKVIDGYKAILSQHELS